MSLSTRSIFAPTTTTAAATAADEAALLYGDMDFVEKRQYRDAYVREMGRNADLNDKLLVSQQVIGELRAENVKLRAQLGEFDGAATPPIASPERLPDENASAHAHRRELLRIIAQSQTTMRAFQQKLDQERANLTPPPPPQSGGSRRRSRVPAAAAAAAQQRHNPYNDSSDVAVSN